MAKYRFPESTIIGFETICKLSSIQVDSVAAELNSSQFGLDADKVVESLKTKSDLQVLTHEQLLSTVKTVYSLLRIDYNSDDEKQKKIDDLINSVTEQISNEDSDIDTGILKDHLNRFLSISGKTKQTIKGFQLLQDNQKNIIDSKINTDIRLVFDEDIDNTKVENAVIIHNLVLEYIENNEIKELFFSLNTNDLIDLKETVQRAIQKESVLRRPDKIASLNFLSLEVKKNN